jgi:RND family efflux transporter MFP subunit
MKTQTEKSKICGARSAIRACTSVFSTCLLLIASGCGEEPPVEEPVARPVKMLTVGGGGSRGSAEYPGKISPAQNAELSFEVPGQIVELPVDEGQEVAKGKLLARLDARDYQARLDSERAKSTQSRAELQRYEQLYKEKVVPLAQLDLKKRTFEVADAATREAAKAVEDTRLKAPFSGQVARKHVDERENVQAKQAIVTLQDTSSLEIVVNVPESDAALARPGLTLEERTAAVKPSVVITSFPDRRFPARIKEFSTTADPVTRTFKVTLAFENPPDVNILPGMTAKVVIMLQGLEIQSGRQMIPSSAVVADESGAAFVWIVDPSTMRVRRAQVEVGDLSGSDVEVQSGLSDGDQIAISGVHSLREGMQVRGFNP